MTSSLFPELASLADTDGLDVVFIGPNDLALALLGYTPAKYTEPEFLGAIVRIVNACKSSGKKVGILVANGEEARKVLENGRFDFVAIGTDVRALQAFYRRGG